MKKKYELIHGDSVDADGVKLFRIRALRSFGNVTAGDLGGYIEREHNLSHIGGAWVFGDARVYGDASIFWASHVGGENGTLTVFRAKAGLMVTRGCFIGSYDEFLAAVDERHGKDSKIGREYHLLIEVARSRIDVSTPLPAEGGGHD